MNGPPAGSGPLEAEGSRGSVRWLLSQRSAAWGGADQGDCERRPGQLTTKNLWNHRRYAQPAGSLLGTASRSGTGADAGGSRVLATSKKPQRLRPSGEQGGRFAFTGQEPAEATVVIRDKTIRVEHGRGLAGLCADGGHWAWLGFLRKERSLVWALLTRQVRLKGPLRLLVAFGKCFPS